MSLLRRATRATNPRAALLLLGLAVLLVVLSACQDEAGPQGLTQDPSPETGSPTGPQDGSPTAPPATSVPSPTPTPPVPVPSPTPTLTPTPSGQPDPPQVGSMAPGFSLTSALGDRVTLEELLEGRDAVVVVFYRGFF